MTHQPEELHDPDREGPDLSEPGPESERLSAKTGMFVLVTDDTHCHPRDEDTETYGQRVYGPYASYDEGKCAAIRLPYAADYWVMRVEEL